MYPTVKIVEVQMKPPQLLLLYTHGYWQFKADGSYNIMKLSHKLVEKLLKM